MLITIITENSKGCLDLIVIGCTHGLEEAWLVVLLGHPHHSPPLALHSNLNPNGFLYSMPHPPTQPCCTLHQQFLLLSIAHSLQQAFLHFQGSKRKWDLPINLLLLLFLISHVHHPWQNWQSNLQVNSWTSSSRFVWFGDAPLSALESTT